MTLQTSFDVPVRAATLRGSMLRTTAPHAPTLLWAHGVFLSTDVEDALGVFDWRAIGSDATIARYDARGHGRSIGTPDPDASRWPALADDLLAVADHLALDRFVAGGMSMGAATALYTAQRTPERVTALLLGPVPTAWELRPTQATVYTQMATTIESSGAAAVNAIAERAAGMVPPLIQAVAPAFGGAVADALARTDPATLAATLRAAATSDLPSPDELRTIAVPTLVLAWDGDPAHPVAMAERVASLLPRAELHVARSAGELAEWPRRVRTFLRSVGSS